MMFQLHTVVTVMCGVNISSDICVVTITVVIVMCVLPCQVVVTVLCGLIITDSCDRYVWC